MSLALQPRQRAVCGVIFTDGVRAGPGAFPRRRVSTAEPPLMLQRLGDARSESRRKTPQKPANHSPYSQHLIPNPLRNRCAVRLKCKECLLNVLNVDFS